MSKSNNGVDSRTPEIPGIVRELYKQGFQEVSQIFNLAISNSDEHDRYDLIHPDTSERMLWTPNNEDPSLEQQENQESRLESIVNKLLDPQYNRAIPSLIRRDDEGAVYKISSSTVSLVSILETSPFIPGYMKRLDKRVFEFMGKIAVLDKDKFGLDLEDIAIDHNGGEVDDIIFSIVPPLKPADDSLYFINPDQYVRESDREIEKYKRRVS